MNFYRLFSHLSSPAQPARICVAPVLWSELNPARPPRRPAAGALRGMPHESDAAAERGRTELRNELKRAS